MKHLLSLLLVLLCFASFSQNVEIRNKDEISPALASQLIDNFTKRINDEPSNGAMYHQRANIYLLQKEYGKAIADLSKSIELKSDLQAESYFMRAIIKQSKNDETACDDFSQAKKLGYQYNPGWEMIDEMCNFKD